MKSYVIFYFSYLYLVLDWLANILCPLQYCHQLRLAHPV